MPTFELSGPSGGTYQIDAPDENSALSAFQQLHSPAKVGVAEDILRSVPSGLANAAAGIAGTGGDVQGATQWAMNKFGNPGDWLTNKFQESFPSAAQFLKDESSRTLAGPIGSKLADTSSDVAGIGKLPTSADVRGMIEGASGPLYHAQTSPGKFIQTTAEFAPLGMVGGAKKIGQRFLTNVAAPAIASEGGGQLTEGTSAEPYARIGGAVLGGMGATKLANSMAERSALKSATPSLSDLKSEATKAYDALTSRNVAIPINQSTLDNLANDLQTTLNNKAIRPSNADAIHKAIEELRTPGTAGAADVADLVAARESIKGLLSSADKSKVGAFVALPKIEAAIEKNSPGAMAKIREADKNWAAAKANEALDKRIARAELRASGENSGANVGNKIRQQVTSYLTSNESKYISAETRADLEKIVRGSFVQNRIRDVGNLLGGGGGLGMLAGGTAGYETGGVPGMLAGAAAGKAFKFANNRSVVKQAEMAAENIRRRSPLGLSNPLQLPQLSNPVIQGLLSGLRSPRGGQ